MQQMRSKSCSKDEAEKNGDEKESSKESRARDALGFQSSSRTSPASAASPTLPSTSLQPSGVKETPKGSRATDADDDEDAAGSSDGEVPETESLIAELQAFLEAEKVPPETNVPNGTPEVGAKEGSVSHHKACVGDACDDEDGSQVIRVPLPNTLGRSKGSRSLLSDRRQAGLVSPREAIVCLKVTRKGHR